MTNDRIFIAVSLALIAAPASANVNAAASAVQKGAKSAGADQKLYCIQFDNIVGSRVRGQQCKTKAEWARQRVDVDKLLKE